MTNREIFRYLETEDYDFLSLVVFIERFLLTRNNGVIQ